MNHMETLNFELAAQKEVLKSEMGTLAHYRRQYHHQVNALNQPDGLNARSCACVIQEYETKHIPRRERFISALEWIINKENINEV